MQQAVEPENYADENMWGVVGDVVEDALYWQVEVPASILILAALFILAVMYIRRRWPKGDK